MRFARIVFIAAGAWGIVVFRSWDSACRSRRPHAENPAFSAKLSPRPHVVLHVIEHEFDVGVVTTRLVPSCLAT